MILDKWVECKAARCDYNKSENPEIFVEKSLINMTKSKLSDEIRQATSSLIVYSLSVSFVRHKDDFWLSRRFYCSWYRAAWPVDRQHKNPIEWNRLASRSPRIIRKTTDLRSAIWTWTWTSFVSAARKSAPKEKFLLFVALTRMEQRNTVGTMSSTGFPDNRRRRQSLGANLFIFVAIGSSSEASCFSFYRSERLLSVIF